MWFDLAKNKLPSSRSFAVFSLQKTAKNSKKQQKTAKNSKNCKNSKNSKNSRKAGQSHEWSCSAMLFHRDINGRRR